jgi:hypothetical protein
VNYIRRCFWEGAGRDLNSCGKEVQVLLYYNFFIATYVVYGILCLVKIIYFLLNPDKGTNDDDDEDDLLASLH